MYLRIFWRVPMNLQKNPAFCRKIWAFSRKIRYQYLRAANLEGRATQNIRSPRRLLGELHHLLVWAEWFCNQIVFIPDFSAKKQQFSAKHKIFLQIHRNTPENSKVHPIRRLVRRTETYPILETFLFLITTWRFGGVGAPEGCEKVPDHIFRQIKKRPCFWRKNT